MVVVSRQREIGLSRTEEYDIVPAQSQIDDTAA